MALTSRFATTRVRLCRTRPASMDLRRGKKRCARRFKDSMSNTRPNKQIGFNRERTKASCLKACSTQNQTWVAVKLKRNKVREPVSQPEGLLHPIALLHPFLPTIPGTKTHTFPV